jgi:hypothetical protein
MDDAILSYVHESVWKSESSATAKKRPAVHDRVGHHTPGTILKRCRQYLTLAKKGSAPDSAKETVKTIFISKAREPLKVEMNAGCLLECCNGQNVIMCSFNDISARPKAEERITYLAGPSYRATI